MSPFRLTYLCACALLFWIGDVLGDPAPFKFAGGRDKRTDKQDCFLVKLKDNAPIGGKHGLFNSMDGDEGAVWDNVFHGFYKCNANMAQLKKFANNPWVEYIEEDAVVTASTLQSLTTAQWNLDRIDQHVLTRDNTFQYQYDGAGVYVYILDTGVRSTHQEFVSRMEEGKDFVLDGRNTEDCHGHGTHVAGTAAGATTGAAKAARIVPVRVLSCSGSGSWTAVLNALDWIATRPKPGVLNLSLGGSFSSSVNTAINAIVSKGYHVAVAAGNDNADASNYSPASAAQAITVGSTTSTDARSSFSNYGSVVDIFAPGSAIYSASYLADTQYATMSGTSMATPLVNGVVAAYLGGNPTVSPADMVTFLRSVATPGLITNLPVGTDNLLLYSAASALPATPGVPFFPAASPQVSPASGPRPSNDLCGAALPITCGKTVSGSTATAVYSGPHDCSTLHTARQVWYYVDLASAAQLQVSTCAAATFDTKLSLFTNTCPSLTCIAGLDDSPSCASYRTSLTTLVPSGRVYIMVHGYEQQAGSFSLTLTCSFPSPSASRVSFSPSSSPMSASPVSPGPSNDFCTTAIPVGCGSVITGSTKMAAMNGPYHCQVTQTSPEVWYAVTVPSASQLTLSTCNQATFDTKLSLFSGSCSGLQCIAGLDDTSGCQGYSTTLVSTVASGVYYVMVHGYSLNVGDFTLSVTCGAPAATPAPVPINPSPSPKPSALPSASPLPAPANPSPSPLRSALPSASPLPAPANPSPSPVRSGLNDVCALAIPVTCGDVVQGSTKLAAFNGPYNCQTPHTSPEVWYAITVPSASQLTLSTCNQANFDTKLSLFSGSCSGLQCVAGLDDTSGCRKYTTTLQANVATGVYYIMVHGYRSSTGDFSLSVSCDIQAAAAGSDSLSSAVSPEASSATSKAQDDDSKDKEKGSVKGNRRASLVSMHDVDASIKTWGYAIGQLTQITAQTDIFRQVLAEDITKTVVGQYMEGFHAHVLAAESTPFLLPSQTSVDVQVTNWGVNTAKAIVTGFDTDALNELSFKIAQSAGDRLLSAFQVDRLTAEGQLNNNVPLALSVKLAQDTLIRVTLNSPASLSGEEEADGDDVVIMKLPEHHVYSVNVPHTSLVLIWAIAPQPLPAGQSHFQWIAPLVALVLILGATLIIWRSCLVAPALHDPEQVKALPEESPKASPTKSVDYIAIVTVSA